MGAQDRVQAPASSTGMKPWKMLTHPGMFVVVARVIGWREAWIQTRSQKGQGSEVTLGNDWNTSVQQERGRNTDALLPAPLGEQATTIRDHLTPACRAHVRQNG